MSENKEVKNKSEYYIPLDRTISNKVKKVIDGMTEEERNKEIKIYNGGIATVDPPFAPKKVIPVKTQYELILEFLEFVKEEEEKYANYPFTNGDYVKDKKYISRTQRVYDCAVMIGSDERRSKYASSKFINDMMLEIIQDCDPAYVNPRNPMDMYNKKCRDAVKEAKAKGKTGNDLRGSKALQEYEKERKPETSLSDDWIKHFDGISDTWLNRWCNFSVNWGWVAPCLLLCLIVNKGLSSAIGLLLFMGIGEWYSWKAKEYCSVIIPWYQRAGMMIERRILKK